MEDIDLTVLSIGALKDLRQSTKQQLLTNQAEVNNCNIRLRSIQEEIDRRVGNYVHEFDEVQ